jgi:hypothetical protein
MRCITELYRHQEDISKSGGLYNSVALDVCGVIIFDGILLAMLFGDALF